MSLHLQREMEDLKKQLLSLCALVEEQVEMAVRALVDHDAELAAAVDRRDAEIDHREVEVEEECLKALALYQPVAIDLRFVVAALKMNNDLERGSGTWRSTSPARRKPWLATARWRFPSTSAGCGRSRA